MEREGIEGIVNSFFRNVSSVKDEGWFLLHKGLSIKDIKKDRRPVFVVGLDNLIDVLLELKPEDPYYISLKKEQCFFPLDYYLRFKSPISGFKAFAPTMNIPKLSGKERSSFSPQELIIKAQMDYVERNKENIKSNDYNVLSTRGFKWYKGNNHVVLSENHLVRGWLLFSALAKLMESKRFKLWYSSSSGNFQVKIPSTSKRNESKDGSVVLTRKYVVSNDPKEWVFFEGETADKGQLYRRTKSKYKITEEFIDHRIVSAMILRQLVALVNKDFFDNDFSMEDHAKIPTDLAIVTYNILPVPTQRTMSLFSALLNRVVVGGRKLLINEIESVFSAMNKKRVLKGEEIYFRDDEYRGLRDYVNNVLYSVIEWVL